MQYATAGHLPRLHSYSPVAAALSSGAGGTKESKLNATTRRSLSSQAKALLGAAASRLGRCRPSDIDLLEATTTGTEAGRQPSGRWVTASCGPPRHFVGARSVSPQLEIRIGNVDDFGGRVVNEGP